MYSYGTHPLQHTSILQDPHSLLERGLEAIVFYLQGASHLSCSNERIELSGPGIEGTQEVFDATWRRKPSAAPRAVNGDALKPQVIRANCHRFRHILPQAKPRGRGISYRQVV